MSLTTQGVTDGTEHWWGTFRVREGAAACWRIGPLRLHVDHQRREWIVIRGQGPSTDRERSVETEACVRAADPDELVTRYAAGDGVESITITPILPDRAVVTRPQTAITVPARGSVSVMVGSPLWLRIEEAGVNRLLEELPAIAPRLTWFGPNTRVGELCYASRTFGRLRLEDLSVLPHRVVTAIKIINHAEQALTLERLKLPVRRLSLFATPGADFWTEPVVLERREGRELAELRVSSGPPGEAPDAKLVSGPRDAEGNDMIRAFGSLFG